MELTLENITIPIKGDISDSMSDKEFLDFCLQNKMLRVERDENKQIIIMAPTTSSTGIINASLISKLIVWNEKKKLGFCFDSVAGFTLSDRSVRSPDASWVNAKKWNQLTDLQKDSFAPICPDFVIELKSKSDNHKYLTAKMDKWIKNGCAFAWLINPENKTAFIFRKDGSMNEVYDFKNILSGEDVLPGFKLDLSILL
ncbi:MAG: Uma2 family endonuclease [Bacteroidota bacterium]|nr:Uma2 family endonuclease [Bacteroidota bacterium]